MAPCASKLKYQMQNKSAFAGVLKPAVIFAVVCYVVHVLLVMGLIVTGLGMGMSEKSVYWVTIIYEPKDYIVVGRLWFMAMALAFNTLVCTLVFAGGYWIVNKLKQAATAR